MAKGSASKISFKMVEAYKSRLAVWQVGSQCFRLNSTISENNSSYCKRGQLVSKEKWLIDCSTEQSCKHELKI